MDISSFDKAIVLGFWLPCGQANFFDPHTDQVLLKTTTLADLNLRSIERLESSVCRRLVTVLHDKGYSHAFWLLPPSRQGYTNVFDPEAVVLICEHPLEWPSDVDIKGVVLIMNEDGFYLWLAIYTDTSEQIGEDVFKKYEEKVQNALTRYIAVMAGGSYFSHFSGKENNKKDNGNHLHHGASYEREVPLILYRNQHKGILNFFQLNLILEGLYNANFDPEVFFSQEFDSTEIKETKERYTLGSFATAITAFLPLEKDASSKDHENSLTESLGKLFKLEHPQVLDDPLAQQLVNNSLTNVARGYILRQFLCNTSTGMLRPLKWTIERCRRSLLNEMMSITHRRQPLLQIESPDEGLDQITKANEAQIRGYVMLIAAKFPLITNVQRYMNNVVEGIGQQDIQDSLSSCYSSWNGLIDAIGDNIHGLEQTIEQGRMDRLLYEEEQIRAEEETMAEIERIRQRSISTLSETDSTAIGLVANGIALLATTIAAIGVLVALASSSPPPTGASLWGDISRFLQSIPLLPNFSQFLRSLPPLLAILVSLFAGVLLYLVIAAFFHAIIGYIRTRYKALKHTAFHLGYRYQYEMDMRLDAHIDEQKIKKLFEAEIDTTGGWWRKFPKHQELGRLPDFKQPERNSYRVERMSEDEALHKVHIETDFLWPRKWLWWLPLKSARKMHSFMTYELLFHRPSEAQSYMLRELRFVATYDRILTWQQLEALKGVLINQFINCWLEKSYQLSIDPAEEPLLVFKTLNVKSSINFAERLSRLKQLILRLRGKGSSPVTSAAPASSIQSDNQL